MRSYKHSSRKPFRMRTYKQHRGWGPILPNSELATRHLPLPTRHFTQVLSFHILAHSFALIKISTLLFSSDSELFAQNTQGWGCCYSGAPPRKQIPRLRSGRGRKQGGREKLPQLLEEFRRFTRATPFVLIGGDASLEGLYLGRHFPVVKQLVERNFESPGHLFERLDARDGVAVLHTRDVATLQAGALLDVPLRKVFLLPDGS